MRLDHYFKFSSVYIGIFCFLCCLGISHVYADDDTLNNKISEYIDCVFMDINQNSISGEVSSLVQLVEGSLSHCEENRNVLSSYIQSKSELITDDDITKLIRIMISLQIYAYLVSYVEAAVDGGDQLSQETNDFMSKLGNELDQLSSVAVEYEESANGLYSQYQRCALVKYLFIISYDNVSVADLEKQCCDSCQEYLDEYRKKLIEAESVPDDSVNEKARSLYLETLEILQDLSM